MERSTSYWTSLKHEQVSDRDLDDFWTQRPTALTGEERPCQGSTMMRWPARLSLYSGVPAAQAPCANS